MQIPLKVNVMMIPDVTPFEIVFRMRTQAIQNPYFLASLAFF